VNTHTKGDPCNTIFLEIAPMLRLGCSCVALSFVYAINLPPLPAHLRAKTKSTTAAEWRGNFSNLIAVSSALQSETFEQDLDLKGDGEKRDLIVQVTSSDQIRHVKSSIHALQYRANWLLCIPAKLDDETKQELLELSADVHRRFGISIRILRPISDMESMGRLAFWVHAVGLDTNFIQEHNHVWLVDKDINFDGFDIDSYMTRLNSLPETPLISQPVIRQNTRFFLQWNNADSWSSRPDVAVAYSTFVDAQAAMVDGRFFVWLMDGLRELSRSKSDRVFNEMWCGSAAVYLEQMGKKLETGVSPCAIVTVPINHEDDSIAHDSHVLRDELSDQWELENPSYHRSLERESRLILEMKFLTPWPDQQCEACSRNQCSKGVPAQKCCSVDMEYDASTSCALQLDIAGSRNVTQVVSPAVHLPGARVLTSIYRTDTPDNLLSAFEASNCALFIITMPDRKDRMVRLAQETFGLPLERIVVVPGVPKNALPGNDELVGKGIVTQEYWAKSQENNVKFYKEGREMSPGRVACYVAHLRAHKAFLDSTFDVALFLEDDVSGIDVDSAAWQRKAHTLFTDPKGFKYKDPIAVYLGYCFETCPAWARNYTLENDISLRDADRPMCTHAYATSRKASNVLLHHALPMDDPIDWVMPRVFKESRVRSLIVNPPMLWQSSDMTPIIGGEDASRSPFCEWPGCDCNK
jgi:GR25 family glycosyltransferase involved in LPS biosynthesis